MFSIREHGIALHLLNSWVSFISFIIISFPRIDLMYNFLDLAEVFHFLVLIQMVLCLHFLVLIQIALAHC